GWGARVGAFGSGKKAPVHGGEKAPPTASSTAAHTQGTGFRRVPFSKSSSLQIYARCRRVRKSKKRLNGASRCVELSSRQQLHQETPSARSCTCPLWVRSRHVQCKRPCPLYPRKRP